MDLFFRILMAVFGLLSVSAAIYNLVTARSTQKQLAKERRDDERLEGVCLLAARTEERVDGLERRVDGFEQRVEKRLEQVARDINEFKTAFTNFLINFPKPKT